MIDPTEDKISGAHKLGTQQLKTHLEHLSPDKSALDDRHSIIES